MITENHPKSEIILGVIVLIIIYIGWGVTAGDSFAKIEIVDIFVIFAFGNIFSGAWDYLFGTRVN